MPADALCAALRALCGNPLRTLLTALSVAIGVCSVIVMSSFARSSLVSMATGLEAIGGAELLVAFPKRARGPRARYAGSLTGEDAAALDSQLPHVRWVSAQSVLGSLPVTAGERQAMADVVAGDSRLTGLLRLKVRFGRDLTPSDNEGSRRVAVIAEAVAGGLFPSAEQAVGRTLHLGGEVYSVVGVLAPGPSFAFDPGYAPDSMVLVPRSRATAPRLSLIMIGTTGRTHNTAVARVATRLLSQRHRGADDFRVFDFSARIDEWRRMLATVELLAAAVAGVALLAGSAGTTNVLMVTLHEQVREIGLRKTLGARASSIVAQFLLQALLIALLGAATGAASGLAAVRLGGALVACFQPGWITVLAPRPAALAVTVALLVTMLAGLVPAWRARRLTIVECLRARV